MEDRVNGVRYDNEAAYLIANTENIKSYLSQSDVDKIKALGEKEFLDQLQKEEGKEAVMPVELSREEKIKIRELGVIGMIRKEG